MTAIKKGDLVKILTDYPDLGLNAGDIGTVWYVYESEPPAYEVTFQGFKNKEFDFLVWHNEIAAIEVSDGDSYA
jgi:hypothetical protein